MLNRSSSSEEGVFFPDVSITTSGISEGDLDFSIGEQFLKISRLGCYVDVLNQHIHIIVLVSKLIAILLIISMHSLIFILTHSHHTQVYILNFNNYHPFQFHFHTNEGYFLLAIYESEALYGPDFL